MALSVPGPPGLPLPVHLLPAARRVLIPPVKSNCAEASQCPIRLMGPFLSRPSFQASPFSWIFHPAPLSSRGGVSLWDFAYAFPLAPLVYLKNCTHHSKSNLAPPPPKSLPDSPPAWSPTVPGLPSSDHAVQAMSESAPIAQYTRGHHEVWDSWV